MLRGHSVRIAFAVLATGIGLVFVPQDANATPVHWTTSVIWNDGGALTGSFDFDATTNIYSNVALTTTPGADVNPGATYSSCVAGDCIKTEILHISGFDITVVHDLQLRYLSPLTNAGGFVAFEGSLVGTKESFYEFSLTGPLIGDRVLPSTDPGGLTGIAATPLPAALPLFATGLGAMGLLGWRRKRKAAALTVA